jgi:hypothetical protein
VNETFTATVAIRRRTGGRERAAALDPRRVLQLVLAVIWLFDGVLQFQPYMFGKDFPQMLSATAQGNPGLVAHPVTWDATLVGHHLAVLNGVFATIQVAIGLGIALRPTIKWALGASVAWALGVWWFGEGLGGVLTGSVSPVSGAPGAVVLYALLAVLLWPAAEDRPAPFIAGRAVGKRVAQVLWLVLWASLAYFALLPASRAPGAASSMVSGMAAGEPGWLTWLDNHLASTLAGQGLLLSALLAAAMAGVAVSTFLPVRPARAGIVLAVLVAAFLWLAEGLGGVLTGSGTDPNSGPLLVLLAVAFWPVPAMLKEA